MKNYERWEFINWKKTDQAHIQSGHRRPGGKTGVSHQCKGGPDEERGREAVRAHQED